jgi:signal transduction histidine kinase
LVILRNRAECFQKGILSLKLISKTGDELEELANSMNKVADELKEIR